MKPHADHACLSKHCKTEDGAAVYDLPVGSTHCPYGHKRLQRLYNAVNVSSGMATKTDRIAGPAVEAALAQKAEGTAARLNALKQQTPELAVPIRNLAGTLAAMGRPVSLDGGRASATPATPSLAVIRGRGPNANVVGRDKMAEQLKDGMAQK